MVAQKKDHFSVIVPAGLTLLSPERSHLLSKENCENWCYHIWSQYDRLLLRYHDKAVSKRIASTIT